ncbi:MAG: phosphopyruvate hydratase [Halobacteriota archaeon]
MNAPIDEIVLREVLDSRGNPTVEAVVYTSTSVGRAAAPSGASTGEHEALELPAGEAVDRGLEVGDDLLGVDASDQREVDAVLREADGTSNFSEIGANAAVALSMAAAKAGANARGVPLHEHVGGVFEDSLPVPLGNVVGGGEHAESSTDVQEYLVVPTGASSFAEAAFANARIHDAVGDVLGRPGKGDEGAWAPSVSDDEAMEAVEAGVDEADVGYEVRLGLDVAASELYDGEDYVYSDANRSTEEQIDYVESLVREHDLVYVEDPLDEDDFEGFAELTERLDDTDALVCGDDLFVTDVERIRRGVDVGAANSVLIKPNQVGTLTGTFEAVETARDAGYAAVMSHRSGETEDSTIAHLAVGMATDYVKTGAVGGERTAKLNELIRIQDRLNW